MTQDNEEASEEFSSRKLTVERSTSTGHRLSRYDGVCGNIHGHNMNWHVEVRLRMDTGRDNMPLDLKEVAGIIDEFDHTLILSIEDELFRELGVDFTDDTEFPYHGEVKGIGDVWVFDGDPTCEVLAQYVADRLIELEPVFVVDVQVNETEKYGISATAADVEAL